MGEISIFIIFIGICFFCIGYLVKSIFASFEYIDYQRRIKIYRDLLESLKPKKELNLILLKNYEKNKIKDINDINNEDYIEIEIKNGKKIFKIGDIKWVIKIQNQWPNYF